MKRNIKVALYGVGVVSSLIAKALLEKTGVEIVSAVDISEDKIGKDLGEILGFSRMLGIVVDKDIESALLRAEPDIVVHATSSSLEGTYPQIKALIEKKMNVVSTCEELVYPYSTNKSMADDLDKLAKKHGVSVLGTGINPGFLMDSLPIMLTGVCLEVKRIKVTRMMNSAKRRIPYQKKIGTGLEIGEFRKKIDRKDITGHVGLSISIAMIADSLGWKLDSITESKPEPVLASKTVEAGYTTVEPGHVAGLKSTAVGVMFGKKVIELEFISYAGAEEEYDSIDIEGLPNIQMKIAGGIHGDTGTVATIINAIPRVLNSPPGFHTMKELPMPSAALQNLNSFVKQKG